MMIELVMPISLAILVLSARLAWNWRWPIPSRGVTLEEIEGARQTIERSIKDMPAFSKLFSINDLRYYERINPNDIQAFIEERKQTAVMWLRRAQQQMNQLMALYSRLARCMHDPPALSYELANWMAFASFLVVSHILIVIVRFRGPFVWVRTVHYTLRVLDQCRGAVSLRLEYVNPTLLSSPKTAQCR